MELSILIAKIIAVVYISSGIAVLIRSVDLNKLVSDFEKSPALTFIAGCVGIVVGLALLQFHNLWVKNWTVLITIISWFMLIGGILIVVFPKTMLYYKNLVTGSRFWGIFMILFGILFGYLGFIN